MMAEHHFLAGKRALGLTGGPAVWGKAVESSGTLDFPSIVIHRFKLVKDHLGKVSGRRVSRNPVS